MDMAKSKYWVYESVNTFKHVRNNNVMKFMKFMKCKKYTDEEYRQVKSIFQGGFTNANTTK